MADEQTPEQIAEADMAKFVSEAHSDGVQIDKDGKPVIEAASDDEGAEDSSEENAGNADESEADKETDTPDDETAEEKAAREAGERAKKKQTAQERIAELTREKHAERREKAAIAAELAALKAAQTAPKPGDLTPPAAADKDAGAPDPAKFEFGELDVKYIAAVAKHEVRKELAVEAAEKAKVDAEAKAKAGATEFQGKVAKLKEAGATKYEDFEDKVFDDSVGFTPTIGELAFTSEFGPDVAYHIATLPPKEREALFGKSPVEQAAYFGRQEAKFSAATAAKTQEQGDKPEPKVTPSKAPNPPANMARGANGKFTPDINKTSDFRTFERLARQQE